MVVVMISNVEERASSSHSDRMSDNDRDDGKHSPLTSV